MRFSNAKIVKEWSYFKFLAMRSVDAQMKVEPWTSNVGANGMLQESMI
jgi:hypothetical protein